MERYWWTVQILTDTGKWVDHWSEPTRERARKVAIHLYGVVKKTRIRGTDMMNPGKICR